jgi:hypothetical protein
VLSSLSATAQNTITANGCTFENPKPQPNETAKFSGSCNQRTAKGKLTWFKDGAVNQIEEGEWIGGQLTGRAKQQFVHSGGSFEGNFVNGKRTGFGIARYKNGDVYEGDFLSGRRSGRGLFKFASGSTYEGDFIDGIFSGRGVLKYFDGSQYTGDFANGRFHGSGEFLSSDRWKITGDHRDGVPSGRVKITAPNGAQIDANFVNREIMGEVIATFPDGRRVTGIVQNGSFTLTDKTIDHDACIRLGYTPSSPNYQTCRERLDFARVNEQEVQAEARRRAIEIERSLGEDRKDAAVARGLGALFLGLGMLRSDQADSSPMRVYTMPGGRSVTCTTMGAFTNCQ